MMIKRHKSVISHVSARPYHVIGRKKTGGGRARLHGGILAFLSLSVHLWKQNFRKGTSSNKLLRRTLPNDRLGILAISNRLIDLHNPSKRMSNRQVRVGLWALTLIGLKIPKFWWLKNFLLVHNGFNH